MKGISNLSSVAAMVALAMESIPAGSSMYKPGAFFGSGRDGSSVYQPKHNQRQRRIRARRAGRKVK